MWQVTTPWEGFSYKNQVGFVDGPGCALACPGSPLKTVTQGVMWVPLGSTPQELQEPQQTQN